MAAAAPHDNHYQRAGKDSTDHERAARAALRALQNLSASDPDPDRRIARCRFLEELSIAGWRTSLHHEAFLACDDLALARDIPEAVIDDARGHLVYYAEPIAGCAFRQVDRPIAKVDTFTGDDDRIPHRCVNAAVNTSNWQGAADPIHWPDRRSGRWVLLIREVVLLKRSADQWQSIDLHRFAEYDDGFGLTRVSRPFTFLHRGTEAVSGGLLSDAGQAILVTFGVEAERAYICRVPLAVLESMLEARVLTCGGINTSTSD